MYTLHWEYMAGSIVAQAMLEESGANYQLHHVNMEAGEHKLREYLSVNPAGRVPALSLPDGSTIGETAAIVTVLGEQLPQANLTPQPGDPDRADFLFWLSVMATSGYLTVARKAHPERYAVDAGAVQQVQAKAASDLDEFFDMLEGAVSGNPFFMTRGFSALDIYLAMLTEWSDDKDALFATRPALATVRRAVAQRPAYRTAIRTHLLPRQAA